MKSYPFKTVGTGQSIKSGFIRPSSNYDVEEPVTLYVEHVLESA